MSENLMNEVAEDIRKERFEKLWKEYGMKVIAGFVVLIALVGGYSYIQQKNIDKAKETGSKYTEALQLLGANQISKAHKGFSAIVGDGHETYRSMARLELAGIAARQGAFFDLDESIKQYQTIVDDKKSDSAFRSIAKIQMIYAQLQRHKTGANDQKILEDHLVGLKPLAESHMSFFHIAKELVGVLQVELGQITEAVETFTSLSKDKKLPYDMRARIQLMNQMLATKIGK